MWAASFPEDHVVDQVSYPSRVTVLAAIHSTKGIVFTFMEGTVTSENYIEALEDHLIPQMRSRMTSDADWDVWQQDGASSHTSAATISFLEENFPFIVSKNSPDPDLQWPPSSPDLNPCDSFLWGYLKSKVSIRNHNQSTAILKEIIVDEIFRS